MSTRSLATDLRALGRRGIAAVRAAPAWLGGILTGVQAAVLTYVALLAPAMAVAAAAPQSTLSAGIEWSGAADVAGQLWLLGHGAPVVVGGASITLVPLGLTLLFGAVLAAIARRFAARTWGSWGLAVASYTTVVALAASTPWLGAQEHMARVTVVAAVLAAVACAIGIWRAHGADPSALARVPALVRAGLRRAAAVAALTLALAAAAQVGWAVLGRHSIADAATALDLDAVGGAVLSVAELAYVPTMVGWSVAWLSGQGFAVGLGTAYAPDALTTDALPVLPILGALPSASGGLLVWAPLLVACVALVVRVVLRRPALGWRRDLAADGVAVAAAGLFFAALALVCSGAAGPGRLEQVGPDPVPTAVALAVLTALGLAVGALADHGIGAALRARRRSGAERSRPTSATVKVASAADATAGSARSAAATRGE